MASIQSIHINPECVCLNEGTWYSVTNVTICPEDADCSKLTWYSDNTDIATVNMASGYIYAKAPGTTTIRAVASGCCTCEGTITVTVCPYTRVETLILDQSTLVLTEGKSATLTVTACPCDADDRRVNWSSSNTAVATVNERGKVQAVSAGNAIIYATTVDGSDITASCNVTVTPNILVSKVEIDRPGTILLVGESLRLSASVTPANALNKTLEWTSDDPTIVTVSPGGIVTALRTGFTLVNATATDGSGCTTFCRVEVKPAIHVESVEISEKSKTGYVGERFDLDFTVNPCCASIKTIQWTSSNESVATVSSSSGRVTPVSGGTTEITVKVNGVESDKCIVTVDGREKVIVKRDGVYNKICFENSQKVWHCMNCDMVFNADNRSNHELRMRLYKNTYEIVEEWDDSFYLEAPKQYSNEELKLIYMIDPYGLANYVNEYAKTLPPDGTDIWNDVRAMVKYKDEIFKLLYGHAPKYFQRSAINRWCITSNRTLSHVISESEQIFGMHQIYDDFAQISLVSLLWGVIQTFGGDTLDEYDVDVERIDRSITYMHKCIYMEEIINYEEIASKIIDTTVDVMADTINISWFFTYFSLLEGLNEVYAAFADKPKQKLILERCTYNLNYRIVAELKYGEEVNISDINVIINPAN